MLFQDEIELGFFALMWLALCMFIGSDNQPFALFAALATTAALVNMSTSDDDDDDDGPVT